MARIVGDLAAEVFSGPGERAQRVYDGELSGMALTCATTTAAASTSVMADELAGQWYARVCGLAEPMVEASKARSTLDCDGAGLQRDAGEGRRRRGGERDAP
jgi:non-lysosomal glucosylceramidase